jgi:hypothetical protein
MWLRQISNPKHIQSVKYCYPKAAKNCHRCNLILQISFISAIMANFFFNSAIITNQFRNRPAQVTGLPATKMFLYFINYYNCVFNTIAINIAAFSFAKIAQFYHVIIQAFLLGLHSFLCLFLFTQPMCRLNFLIKDCFAVSLLKK